MYSRFFCAVDYAEKVTGPLRFFMQLSMRLCEGLCQRLCEDLDFKRRFTSSKVTDYCSNFFS